MTREVRRSSIEEARQEVRALTASKQVSVLRFAQRAKQLSSASLRDEYGYAREA